MATEPARTLITPPAGNQPEELVQYDPTGRYQKVQYIEQSRGIRHVYKAFDTETAVEVAWQEYWGVSVTTMNAIEKQIETLKSLKHKHIITYHEGWVDRKQKKVFFITEAMPTGKGSITNVRRFLSRNVKMKMSVLKNWLEQVLNGLEFLHSCDPPWLHQDLRCEHIYIRSNIGLLKIGALELGVFIQNSHPAEFDGTPGYMAPELANEQFERRSDIYAFGMCALEMFTFKYPYVECSTSYQIFRRQLNNTLPESLSLIKDSAAVDLISKCLAPLSERPTVEDLLKHSFFVGDDASVESEDLSEENITHIRMRERHLLDEQRRMSTNTPNELTMISAPKSPRHQSMTSDRLGLLTSALEEATRNFTQVKDPSMKPVVGDPSVKCYCSDGRCIRLYYKAIFTVDVLRQCIISDFELIDTEFCLQYLDMDDDKVMITKRTTIMELMEFAKSIQVTLKEQNEKE